MTGKETKTLEPNLTSNTPIAKPPEPPKPEEPPPFIDKTNFVPPKPISHSPKISPSSIPNPNPSVTTTKQVESGYSNYSGYLYSVPGYSAFQPVAYPGIVKPNATAISQKETSNSEFIAFSTSTKEKAPTVNEDKTMEPKITEKQTQSEAPKLQTDFEEKFMPEIISTSSETNKSLISESKLNVSSLTQTSDAMVATPTQTSNNEVKKKPPERFSLKTSIPISKIDMKCVNNPPDSIFPNHLPKKPFNPAFHTPNIKENGPKIEIQSNIVIKSALKESDDKEIAIISPPSNSINTLINAAEAINKNESQFKRPDPKPDQSNESKESSFTATASKVQTRPIFNPINLETNKMSVTTKSSDSPYNESKNQILFIQNNNSSNPKMLLTIQQQNPHVLLQRTEFNPKNLQAPSRPSSLPKKCKEELVNENGTSSKVVSLKRMHQDNCDENDFENLITENQIYGNKIVVKEKSQGTLQEQDLKNKVKSDKLNCTESKNVVLQPNFVYLSNVQFPANLMMIKNNNKVNTDSNKQKAMANESKLSEISTTNLSNDSIVKGNRSLDLSTNKEIHVLKTSNNVLQTLTNKNNKADLVFQTSNQKVIMNPQIVYQVPMIVDSDSKLNQSFVKGEYPKMMGQNKREIQKPFEQTKTNDKLFITCPYQMDSKLQPKIVITNIRPKIPNVEEVSSLDIYEQRKKLRRLKYLSNRDVKNIPIESQKIELKKFPDFTKNIITPEKMKAEIYKEFANTKITIGEDSNDSESDYGEEDLQIFNSLIEEYGDFEKNNESIQNNHRKIEFLAQFKLASQNEYNERNLQRQEKIFRTDSVACAYIAAGRIDCLLKEENITEESKHSSSTIRIKEDTIIKEEDQQSKRKFLFNLKLKKVTPQQKQDYENVWQEIEKERKRREISAETGHLIQRSKLQSNIRDLDPKGQLKILTEIKNHVTENNNRIKRRLDSQGDDGESIKVLAEKNFSELNRLSKMADRSVKHFSGQNTRKRDLNPGFDSENIQKYANTAKAYPTINIPNISKIISLKSTPNSCTVSSTQATSMDEPQNSAAGINEIFCDNLEKVQDFSCQADTLSSWPGIEVILKTYKEYESARKKEIIELHKRNTSLRVESAHITRAASRDSDRARALLAERRNLANEERSVRNSIQWFYTIVDLVRNYD